MSRKYPTADVKILYGRAAGRCAFPKCRIELVLEETDKDKTKQIGKIAHIVAHSSGGPRSAPSYPNDKLDTYENWILLCPTCHDTVDAQDGKYDVSILRNLKTVHEKWVCDTLGEAMSSVEFAELEVAVRGIASRDSSSTTEFTVIPPDEKIIKNALSNSTRGLLVMGLMRGAEVEQYLTEMNKLDSNFVDRLISGFKGKYVDLIQSGLAGDALFEELLNFAASGSTDFLTRAAGLAFLSYLFETCEVFEK